MIQPFCCDITTGSIEEQNEFKRLFRAVSKYDWKFGASYYGVDLDRKFANEFNKHSAKHWFNNNFIPLSEGILILKKMVGEEEKPRTDLKVVRDRIVDAVLKSLIYNTMADPHGKIEGINMEQLEQRIDGILDSLQPKP